MLRSLAIINSALTGFGAFRPSAPFRNLITKGTFIEVPKPGNGKAFRRKVHFPEKYTIQPLKITNLGGRDPITGRVVVHGIGGGIKYKYHWVKFFRDGPTEGPPKEEKVLKIIKCHCRTSFVALVASKDELKYILATENMKPGDIIKTIRYIPPVPVKPHEGDAYPVGALPQGCKVHNVQLHPSSEVTVVHAAGTYALVKGEVDNKIILQLPSKQEIVLEKECMVTVGRLSNVEHSSIPIGSPKKSRELGFRPKSGLKKKKTGRFGRKIKPPPKIKTMKAVAPKEETSIRCTIPNYLRVDVHYM